MSSGGRRVQYNTRERLISTDPNRAQDFQAQATADILRFWLDARNDLDVRAGGLEDLGTGAEVDLRAVILNGLRVEPIVASTSLVVHPGVGLFLDTAAPTFGNSIGSWVIDPGQLTLGVLTLTANGGGGIRIDVIECQTVDFVETSDSRDIFNPATGLFSPSVVTKGVQKRLTYRIRTGTSGAGFPGLAAGWLPLAVAAVPVGAVTWDDARVWDVRPLASDMVHAPMNSPRFQPSIDRQFLWTDILTAPGESRLEGQIETEYLGSRAGGRIIQGGLEYLDLADTANLDGNIGGLGGATWWYLYAAFPFGLPRWVELQPASAGARLPTGLRGIPIVSDKGSLFDGTPSSNIAVPTAYGLASPANDDATLLAAGFVDTGFPQGILVDGTVFRTIGNLPQISADGGSGLVTNNWTLTEGTDFPQGVKALWLRLSMAVTTSMATEIVVGGTVQVSDKTGSSTTLSRLHTQAPTLNVYSSAAGAYTLQTPTLRVSLHHDFGTVVRTFLLRWSSGIVNANVTWVSASLQVFGWEYVP